MLNSAHRESQEGSVVRGQGPTFGQAGPRALIQKSGGK